MKVYLDACCLSRLTDDQAQERIRKEAEAMERILSQVEGAAICWASSEVLIDELSRNPAPDRRADNEALLALATETVRAGRAVIQRAAQLVDAGFGSYDALHIASAEGANADVMLSTDDRLVRRAARADLLLRVEVANPLSWLQAQGL